MRALGTAALLSFLASQAYALSCAEPNIERSFNSWVDAEETYYIGVGSLKSTSALPEVPRLQFPTNDFGKKDPIGASYLFTGELLDGDRGHAVELPITINVNCIGPWCGGFPKEGTTGLMALRGVGLLNLTLDIHACPGAIFPTETETTVSACIRAGRCEER